MNGLIDNAAFQTTDLRLNLNYDINEKLRVEARFSTFFSESDFAEGGDLIGGDQSFVQQTVTYNPIRANGLEDISDFFDRLDGHMVQGHVDQTAVCKTD